MQNKDYVGTDINDLKIIGYSCEVVGNQRRQYFKYICVCGRTAKARANVIKSGETQSCGCISAKLRSKSKTLPDNVGIINILYRSYKRVANKRELVFSLDKEQFRKLIFDNCFYCGSKPNSPKRIINYNGIDRVNNKIGYVIDNCVTCCYICNRAKSNLSLTDFKKWIKGLIEFQSK